MSGQMTVSPSVDRIAENAKASGSARDLPRIHEWDPPFCGDIDMRIARDGTWFFEGTPINRPRLVRLFSTILRKEGERFYLVTPVEKVGITVEDAPFVAVDVELQDQGCDQRITFFTNVEDRAVASPQHPIRIVIDETTGEPAPYVLIRHRLEALIDRKTFYRLVGIGTYESIDGESWFGVRSNGTFFPFVPSSEVSAP